MRRSVNANTEPLSASCIERKRRAVEEEANANARELVRTAKNLAMAERQLSEEKGRSDAMAGVLGRILLRLNLEETERHARGEDGVFPCSAMRDDIRRVLGSDESEEENNDDVTCKFCTMDTSAITAHSHDGGYVCVGCWDDRLRSTE